MPKSKQIFNFQGLIWERGLITETLKAELAGLWDVNTLIMTDHEPLIYFSTKRQ